LPIVVHPVVHPVVEKSFVKAVLPPPGLSDPGVSQTPGGGLTDPGGGSHRPRGGVSQTPLSKDYLKISTTHDEYDQVSQSVRQEPAVLASAVVSIREAETKKTKETDRPTDDDALKRFCTFEKIVRHNIEYESFTYDSDKGLVDNFVDVMVDVLATDGGSININGESKPRAVVRSVYMKLTHTEIECAVAKYKSAMNTVKNHKGYIRIVLYNAQLESNAYLENLVSSRFATATPKLE